MAKVKMNEEYPSNSITSREEETAPTKIVTKVTSGTVTQIKQPLIKRMFGETAKDLGSYLLWDLLIPAFKEILSDVVNNATDIVLYGSEGSSGRRGSKYLRRDKGTTYVSYSSLYDSGSSSRRRSSEKRGSNRLRVSKSRHDFDSLILESRGDGEEVLSVLVELIDIYGAASVAELYKAVGLEPEWGDVKWGWDSLGEATVKRVREGYILDLPKPIPLD